MESEQWYREDRNVPDSSDENNLDAPELQDENGWTMPAQRDWRIGELADMFGINVQLLRHYDKIGLLVPRIRNPETGRRTYGYDQMYPLALIRYLRRMGCPLESIRGFMEGRTPDVAGAYLREQSAILHRQVEELLRLDRVITRKLDFTEKEYALVEKDDIRICSLDDIHYVDLGELNEIFLDEYFYFYPTLAFYRGSNLNFGAYLLDTEFNPEKERPNPTQKARDGQEQICRDGQDIAGWQECRVPLKTIPAGKYLVGYHFGPYMTIGDTFARMKRWYGHPVEEEIICVNIIDQFVEAHQEHYVTKVLMRIIELP